MESLRILILAPRLVGHGPSSEGRYASNLSSALCAEGHEVEVLTTDFPQGRGEETDCEDLIVSVLKDTAPGESSRNWFIKSTKFVSHNAGNYDVIHSVNLAAAGLVKYNEKRFKGLPSITTITAPSRILEAEMYGYHGKARNIFLHHYLNSMSAIIVHDQSTYNALLNIPMLSEGDLPYRMVIIPRGVDTDKFNVPDTARYSWNTVLFLGILSERKNTVDILRTAEKILSSHHKARVVVSGSGPYAETLEKIKPERMEITGELPEDSLVDMYQNSSLFIYPSASVDYIPYPMLEAMATGLPAVAYSAPAFESIPGVETVEEGNTEELARRAVELLQNPEILEEMGNEARKYITSVHSLKHTARTTLTLYKKML